jgi:hypothetical protein
MTFFERTMGLNAQRWISPENGAMKSGFPSFQFAPSFCRRKDESSLWSPMAATVSSRSFTMHSASAFSGRRMMESSCWRRLRSPKSV